LFVNPSLVNIDEFKLLNWVPEKYEQLEC
jgi:hypothetical protein